jgi:hypothetical protein
MEAHAKGGLLLADPGRSSTWPWVKPCQLHHPPVITIFMAGISTVPKWVVYDCFTMFYPD